MAIVTQDFQVGHDAEKRGLGVIAVNNHHTELVPNGNSNLFTHHSITCCEDPCYILHIPECHKNH